MEQRSQYARALESPLFRLRVVKPRKGKGSYDRKQSGKEDKQ